MLGYSCFQPGKSMYQKALGRMRDELLYIINTPDLFWRLCQEPEANTIEEMQPSYTGPRMFLLVLHDKQLSLEEVEMFTKLKERFGEKMTKNITVVLIDNKETSRQSSNIEDINLKKILQECDKRICVFSKDTAESELVRELLIHITKTSGKLEADPGSSSLSCRLHEDMNKNVPQKEKDESEQPKTMPGEGVNDIPFGGDCKIITMVLLGINSDDKCLIGNSILQYDCFVAGKTTCERVVARAADQMVYIVNTHDLFHKQSPDPIADSMEEMKPSYAGPRMFIMVLQDRALSKEEIEMFAQLKERFGKKLLENMIVVLIAENAKMEQSGGGDKITLVLLGKNSNDTSMIGNTILKAKRFIPGKDTCTRVEEKVDDHMFCIINTPDLFFRSLPDRETDSTEETKPLYPGPRVFLLVLTNKQLSQEEMEMFSQLKVRFGEKMVENTIVVLVNSQEKKSGEPHDQADENLKKLLDECGQRIYVHDKEKDNELTKQVVKEWRRIHEKQVKESSNSAPAER
ncbi:hypothetical protein Q8A67_023412 [Cirrhinus molitorella]|uniref:AIG1-type G domain-containing protein n=1 Tax=Cirrhinus molitorella TaxID=172907 RepID=A0AA88P5R7_9TELE|nr:hypothetical protein Q8A67_023412 [Cirrhinus molitorella]